jgi:hypothetical protein
MTRKEVQIQTGSKIEDKTRRQETTRLKDRGQEKRARYSPG